MHETCLKKCFKSKKKNFVNAIAIFALFATILQREGYIACSLFCFFAVSVSQMPLGAASGSSSANL